MGQVRSEIRGVKKSADRGEKVGLMTSLKEGSLASCDREIHRLLLAIE